MNKYEALTKLKTLPDGIYEAAKERSGDDGFDFIYDQFEEKKITNAIEIGTFLGHGTAYIAAACSNRNGKVYTIEIDKTLAHTAQALIEHVGLSENVDFILGDSLAELPKLLKRIPAFQAAYIDGHHSYKYVSQEFKLIYEAIDKTRPFLIILDDACYEHNDSRGDGTGPKIIETPNGPCQFVISDVYYQRNNPSDGGVPRLVNEHNMTVTKGCAFVDETTKITFEGNEK